VSGTCWCDCTITLTSHPEPLLPLAAKGLSLPSWDALRSTRPVAELSANDGSEAAEDSEEYEQAVVGEDGAGVGGANDAWAAVVAEQAEREDDIGGLAEEDIEDFE
jgi:hypothetical protein